MWTGLVMLIVLRLPNPTSAEWMQLGRHDSGTNHTELPLPAEIGQVHPPKAPTIRQAFLPNAAKPSGRHPRAQPWH